MYEILIFILTALWYSLSKSIVLHYYIASSLVIHDVGHITKCVIYFRPYALDKWFSDFVVE